MRANKKQQESIKKLKQEVVDNINNLENYLMPTELIVLKILSESKHACTTQFVKGLYVMTIIESLSESVIKSETKKSEIDIKISVKIGTLKKIKIEDVLALTKMLATIPKNSSQTKFIESAERGLRLYLGIELPSFERIDAILTDFEEKGIVARRFQDDSVERKKRGKYLWYITPEFSKLAVIV